MILAEFESGEHLVMDDYNQLSVFFYLILVSGYLELLSSFWIKSISKAHKEMEIFQPVHKFAWFNVVPLNLFTNIIAERSTRHFYWKLSWLFQPPDNFIYILIQLPFLKGTAHFEFSSQNVNLIKSHIYKRLCPWLSLRRRGDFGVQLSRRWLFF